MRIPTMTHVHHADTRHTTWCAQGHRCGLGEHRSDPHTITIPGAGSIVLTRVQNASGAQCAEVRLSVLLPDTEPDARQQLTALLTHLRTLIGPPRAAHRPHRRPA